MERLFQIIDNVRKLDEGKMFVAVFDNPKVKDIVIELNTEGQLRLGIRADGSEMPNYSITSQDLFGKDDIPIQLYDSGDFYESFKVAAVTPQTIVIFADTIKEDDNLLRFGDIIGLTDESIGLLSDKIIPFIIDYVKKQILR